MMERMINGKQAVRCPSGRCGHCRKLNSDKEKKIQRGSPSPSLFLGEELDGGEGEKARIPKGRPVE